MLIIQKEEIKIHKSERCLRLFTRAARTLLFSYSSQIPVSMTLLLCGFPSFKGWPSASCAQRDIKGGTEAPVFIIRGIWPVQSRGFLSKTSDLTRHLQCHCKSGRDAEGSYVDCSPLGWTQRKRGGLCLSCNYKSTSVKTDLDSCKWCLLEHYAPLGSLALIYPKAFT